jgi:hypothetical protein
VLLEIRLQLLLGPARIDKELLPRSESEPADIAISHARRFTDESCNLQVTLWHGSHDGKAMAPGQIEIARPPPPPSTAPGPVSNTGFALFQECRIAFERAHSLGSFKEPVIGVFIEDFAKGGKDKLDRQSKVFCHQQNENV